MRGVDAPRRAARFAVGRAASFALATTSFALAGAVAVVACSDGEHQEGTSSFDASPPPPPGPCIVTRTTAPICEAATVPADTDSGADAASDAGDAAASDAGDAGDAAADAAEPESDASLPPPPSENVCLVTTDTTVACPSAVAALEVAAGRDGSTDLVVSQRGLGHYASSTNPSLVGDDHAYTQHVHLDPQGNGVVTQDPLPPFPAGSSTSGHFALLPATASADPTLAFVTPRDGGGLILRAGRLVAGSPVAIGAPFELPGSGTLDATFFDPSSALVATRNATTGRADGAPLQLLRGLPDAPHASPTSVTALSFVVSAMPTGTLAGLFLNPDGTLELREGDGFDTQRWSYPLRDGAGSTAFFDVAYVDEAGGAVPAVLLDDGSSEITVRMIRSADYRTQPYAILGASFSTCPRSTYVGITCDECPTSTQCQLGADEIHAARLVAVGGRLFALFLATDVRRTMGYSLDKTPIIGVGCVCAIHERSRQEVADSLVLVEVTGGPTPTDPPVLVEHMRLPLFQARATGLIKMIPRSDGDLDVVAGGAVSADYSSVLTEYPKNPTQFRALRVSTKSLPPAGAAP